MEVATHGEPPILAIDFGTSFSSAAATVDGALQMVVEGGDPRIPTVIHLPRRSDPVIGYAARSRLASSPHQTIASIKRILGARPTDRAYRRYEAATGHHLRPSPDGGLALEVNGQLFACEQIASYALSWLRERAEQRWGVRFSRAVMSVPVVACPGYVPALMRAARLAHLDVIATMPEPVAGARAFGVHAEPANRELLVVDFGGGTLDATLLIQDGSELSPIASGGDDLLGGDDFDDALAQALANGVERRSGYDMRRDAERWMRLRFRCESIKRVLSSRSDVLLNFRDAFLEGGHWRALEVRIDREWAEAQWGSLIDRMRSTLSELYQAANRDPRQTTLVVTIGGTMLIPSVRRALAESLPHARLVTGDQAGVAVAIGTALRARELAQASGSSTRK